jgi:hypothetical protein
MPCLNDIEEDLIEKKYIFELINLLEKDLHVDLYGIYQRILNVSINCLKLEKEKNENILINIKKLLLMLINVKLNLTFIFNI